MKFIYKLDEVAKLNILESGLTDEGLAFVELENSYIFYGYPTTEIGIHFYNKLSDKIKKKLTKESCEVANDITTRYQSPEIHGNMKEKFHVPQKGDIVLELGSFTGFYSIKLSEYVGKEGRVIAVEPIPENLEILRKNIEINKISNVTIIPKAIWSERGNQEFYQGIKQQNSFFRDVGNVEKNKIIIESDTVDNIINDLNLDKIDYILMEINGAELEALKGMEKTLQKQFKLVIAAQYITDGTPNYFKVIDVLKEKGFTTNVYKEGLVFAEKNN